MLKALKRALGAAQQDTHAQPAQKRRQLELAVAVLLHEARRADYAEGDNKEATAAQSALVEIFGLERPAAAAKTVQRNRRICGLGDGLEVLQRVELRARMGRSG